jgi:N-acetylglucosaminyldiphosphoundecaprenol N-acetyl-beta-D-mannosaminyltransferase
VASSGYGAFPGDRLRKRRFGFWRKRVVRSVEILGIRVDDATYADLLAKVDEFVAAGQPHQVVTVNTEMLVAAYGDSKLAEMLNAGDLNVADSVGVILASRLLGYPLRERVTGSDGIHELARHCAKRGYRVFLLGALPGVAERTAQKLQAEHGELQVVGTYAGSPNPDDSEAVISRVEAVSPDLLLVAYGVPAEERWIGTYGRRLGVPVMIGVGGTFDFVAGVIPRAPGWMRTVGLEWLYRLIREPWRWRRQLALPRFVALVLLQRLKSRSYKPAD